MIIENNTLNLFQDEEDSYTVKCLFICKPFFLHMDKRGKQN